MLPKVDYLKTRDILAQQREVLPLSSLSQLLLTGPYCVGNINEDSQDVQVTYRLSSSSSILKC